MCTIRPRGIVQYWSCDKAVVNVIPQTAQPSSATRTGQYLWTAITHYVDKEILYIFIS